MEPYKKKFEENIQQLIEQGLISEAKELLKEYEEIVKGDSELYSMKGVIAIMEGDWDGAKNTLLEGLKLDSENFDLLYNLAFVYQSAAQNELAIKCYVKALCYAQNEKSAGAVYSSIRALNLKKETTTKSQERLSHQKYKNHQEENQDLDNCEIIIINTDNKISPSEGDDIYSSRKNVVDATADDDAPLVSIYVLAYNNLEKYTRTCIECILKYTQDIDYELILIDNGSSDGTLDYFKSVKHPQKKIIQVTKNVGAMFGSNLGLNLTRGKYVVGVSNDIYVTKNWLTNMLKCVMSDDCIGMVVPMSDNISNFQSPDWSYKDFEDMQEKAALFNVSDPKKWHEKLRLVTPIALFTRECLNMVGKADYGFFHDFADDDTTFRVRRAGYKAILCKDVFICHAGKITDKGIEIMAHSLQKGRETFKQKYHGIDAWDDVCNYEPTMMSFIEVKQKKQKSNLLGIDVSCGTPLLEVKNRLKERGVFKTVLAAFTTQPKYWLDLSTICDQEVKCDRIEYLPEHFPANSFDYIILGNHLNGYSSPFSVLNKLLMLLTEDGSLLLKIRNDYDVRAFLYILGKYKNPDEEVISHLSLDKINEYLKDKGFYIEKISGEGHQLNENTKEVLRDYVTRVSNDDNAEQLFNKLIIKDYILKIAKRKIMESNTKE